MGRIPALLLLVFLLLTSLAAPLSARGAMGELVMLKGQATVFRGNRSITVLRRYLLESEDRVRTEVGGKAHFRFFAPLRGSEFVATGDTEFVIRDVIPRKRNRHLLSLVWGAIRSRLAAFSRERSYMRTATAVIGVKGTDFIVYVKRQNASEFIGVEGLIEAASRSLPDSALRIGKRQWGEIVAGEKPKPPIRVPDELWFPALKEFSFPGEAPQEPPTGTQ